MAEVFRIRRTTKRAQALSKIMAKSILYSADTGDYFEQSADGSRQRLAGAQRRTYATLRSDDLVSPGEGDTAPLGLTERGLLVAEKWELTSQQNHG